SGSVLFLYDWMLILPVELDVVWSKKLRPLDVLYIIQQYMPFLDTIGIPFLILNLLAVGFMEPIMEPNTCHILFTISGFILMMRTWALWEKDIRLTIGLPIFFVMCWTPTLYMLHVGCVVLMSARLMFLLVWVILLVYEAVLLTLMLIPGIHYCV
ncbi:hypothetical protein BDP27DRAFT_1226540, partial [Rhodocollybia butyracea]